MTDYTVTFKIGTTKLTVTRYARDAMEAYNNAIGEAKDIRKAQEPFAVTVLSVVQK